MSWPESLQLYCFLWDPVSCGWSAWVVMLRLTNGSEIHFTLTA